MENQVSNHRKAISFFKALHIFRSLQVCQLSGLAEINLKSILIAVFTIEN